MTFCYLCLKAVPFLNKGKNKKISSSMVDLCGGGYWQLGAYEGYVGLLQLLLITGTEGALCPQAGGGGHNGGRPCNVPLLGQ